MKAEKRQPWGKWYWGDWRKDARLRRCSYGARGLWADMLSLMGGECERYGALIMDGQPLTIDDLENMLGGSAREIEKLTRELETKRVFNRVGDDDVPDDVAEIVGDTLPQGTIISRRMVRDKAKADTDRENGRGGGNPSLKPGRKPKEPDKDNGGVNPEDKAQKLEARLDSAERKKDFSEAKASGADAPTLEAEVYRRGRSVLGKSAGGQITNLRKVFPQDDATVLLVLDQAKTKGNPAEWVAGVIRRGGLERDELGLPIARERYNASDDYERMAVDI